MMFIFTHKTKHDKLLLYLCNKNNFLSQQKSKMLKHTAKTTPLKDVLKYLIKKKSKKSFCMPTLNNLQII